MANVKTLNKRRMDKAPKSGPRASSSASASDILNRALGTSSGSSGDLMPRGGSDLESPGGRSLMQQGSRSVARPGGPMIDTDSRTSPGIKDIGRGSGIKTSTPSAETLPAPKATSAPSRGLPGLGARLAGGIGLAAYSPDVGEGSDKPKNYPGEGLQSPQGKAESSIPAPKKPKVAVPRRAKATSSADDDFMADLRASAAKMKDTTADMAEKTGRMKGAMADFSSAADDATDDYKRGGKVKGFAKGGRVGGRGDGIAQRGKTKGRFC